MRNVFVMCVHMCFDTKCNLDVSKKKLVWVAYVLVWAKMCLRYSDTLFLLHIIDGMLFQVLAVPGPHHFRSLIASKPAS